MNDNEVNKIIAEFVGYFFSGYDSELKECYGFWKNESPENEDLIPCYTESLDSLVPVWEKLKKRFDRIEIDITNYNNAFWFQRIHEYGEGDIVGFTQQETIQKSAAYATAEAIMELKNE